MWRAMLAAVLLSGCDGVALNDQCGVTIVILGDVDTVTVTCPKPEHEDSPATAAPG